MAEVIAAENKADVVVTHELRVICDGPPEGRHPRVYLSIEDDAAGQPDQVVCPYCSRVFMYKAKNK